LEFSLEETGVPILKFPINPEEVTIRREKQYETVNIMNIGEIDFAQGEKVKEITFSSFFPGEYDPSYCLFPDIPDPQEAMNRLTAWAISKQPVRLMITETIINALVLVSAHTTSFKGGHPGDVYFDLTCRTWREIKVRTAAEIAAGSASPGSAQRPQHDTRVESLVYVVKPGDTLWAIAKREYGDGGRYSQIYNANKDVIGPSPHLIKPGQRLVMPR
jgi:nucleoid-associated protein YgaU